MENTQQEPTLEQIFSFQDDNTYTDNGFNDDAPADPAPVSGSNPDEEEEGKTTSTPSPIAGEGSQSIGDTTSTITDVEFQKQLLNNYELLRDNGILIPKEGYEFDGTPEGFKQVLDMSKDAYADIAKEQIMKKLDDKMRRLFEYALNGGESLEEFNNTSIDYDSIDLSPVNTQKQVLAHHYQKTTKFTDAQIQRHIDRAVSDGSLFDEAADAIISLKALQSSENEAISKRNAKRLEERREEEKQFRNSVATEIQGLEYIAAERQKKVKNFYSNPVTKPDGQLTEFNRVIRNIQTNPKHLAQLADILYDYDKKEGLNLDRLSKLKITKQTSDFKTQLQKALNTKVNVSSAGNTPPSKEQFDFEAFLKQ